MTEDQLAAIPQADLAKILHETPAAQLHAVLESHLNIEWWRGYYAGREQVVRHLQQFAEQQASPRTVS